MITSYNKFTCTFTASSSLFNLNILQILIHLDGLRALLDNLLISFSFIWKNSSWCRWRFLTGLQGVLRALKCQSNSWWITLSSFSVLSHRANISVLLPVVTGHCTRPVELAQCLRLTQHTNNISHFYVYHATIPGKEFRVNFNNSGPYPIHVLFTSEIKPLRC